MKKIAENNEEDEDETIKNKQENLRRIKEEQHKKFLQKTVKNQ
jgi:hypothetical protein